MHPIRTSKAYIRSTPFVFMYQAGSGLVLAATTSALKELAMGALYLKGRVAVTTGDFTFLFTTWQGWLILLLAVLSLYLFIALESCGNVAYAKHWVLGERTTVREVLKEGFTSTKRLLSPFGLVMVLYVALLAPLLGIGSSLSVTNGLHMPYFITSVIESVPLYHALYLLACVLFAVFGFAGTFFFQGIVYDGLPAWESYKQSVRLMKDNLSNYLANMVLFFVILLLLGILIGLVIPALLTIAYGLAVPSAGQRVFSLLYALLIGLAPSSIIAVFSFYLTLKHTQLYRRYTAGEEDVLGVPGKSGLVPFVVCSVVVALLFIPISHLMDAHFEELFPKRSDVAVIAHRAGGSEAPENTVAALDVAANAGAWGAEIDIQRTADGHYVVNHDDDFKRVSGDSRTPSQMTLEEVKQLTVCNPDGTPSTVPVATYEEMLEGSRDRLVLFVELKGKTADRQMADDAVRIARDMGMLDQCVFISLKYDLIDYLAKNYDDVQTGFLEFASFGDGTELSGDYLAMEEELATSITVDDFHEKEKKILVWTVNSKRSQKYFLDSECDAIITDNITQAAEVRTELEGRDDITRALERVARSLF